jgi:hypothetical protein
MTRSALLLIATVLAVGATGNAVQQTEVPLGARLKMHWKESSISFREGAAEHEIKVRDYFHAVRLDKVILQSAKESNGFIYLLLDVTGPSKLPPDSHQCGAGTESDLIWLKLDKNWKPQDEKDFRYDSCWATISSDDPPKWAGDTLKVTVFSVTASESKTLVATYSYKHPDEGLRIAEDPAGK